MHERTAAKAICCYKLTIERFGGALPNPRRTPSITASVKPLISASFVILMGLLVPLIASAEICPIEHASKLPPQGGHPWTKLASCVSSGNAVVGGMVGGTDCTNAYIGEGQGLHGAGEIGTINVQSGGTLVFLDQNYTLEVGSITVQNGGTLQIGAKACPISSSSEVQIFFTGSEGVPEGIDVQANATLRMWGDHGNTTYGKVSWTHLAQPAGPSKFDAAHNVLSPVANAANTIVVSKTVYWNPGDWIVVAGTNYSPDSAEFVQIQTISPNSPAGQTTITLNQPLIEYHFGGPSPTCATKDPYCGPSPTNFNDGKHKNYGIDERAEVGLLSRSIHLTSITPNPYQQTGGAWKLINPPPVGLHWGAEIKVESGFNLAEISGVEMDKAGGDQDGQFPIYFTGTGSQSPIISSNSIHHSYNKCIALAGLNTPTTINDNVCARIVGNMFYLQTGMEQNLSFIHNLGVGAMSNGFVPNPDQAPPKRPPLYQLWWAGDNLTNQPAKAAACPQPEPGTLNDYNCYDGFNVPFTDGQSESLGARQLAGYESSGFWITNPANYFEANSIAGCQDQGIGFWYDLVPANANVPLGILQGGKLVGFKNNRAHGCYYGLNTPTQISTGSLYTPQQNGLDLIAHFDGVTATRNRNIGIWARAAWYSFTNARLGGNLEGASLASAGGTEGSPPGEWAQITGATFVGATMNNPERFGPCPYDTFGVLVGTTTPTVPGPYCAEYPLGANASAVGIGFPGPKRNEIGYMFYDGPARVENSRFVNYKSDISQFLTTKDATFLTDYSTKTQYWNPTMPCDTSTPFVYEGDTAIGWFQSNVNSYPPTQYTENISFKNVDLRHEVYTQEVGVTCASTGIDFQDGDKNTVILDHDASLSGYQVVDSTGKPIWGKFPISLNNLPFLAVADTTNNVMNTVDECYAQGGQDTVYEDRPTAQMSPNDYATLEFSAVPCALESGDFVGPPPFACSNPNVITFTKDQQDYSAHQTMSLNGRNQNGIYEPKVMNGLGYTVQAQYEMPPNINITYTDASAIPFQTRLGICYTTPSGPIQCPNNDCSTVFTVSKGVKTLGEPGSTSLSALAPYFTDYTVCNGLDNQDVYLDDLYNLPNLVYCPDPSSDPNKGSDKLPPTPAQLAQVSTLDQLTPSTYFYDQKSGLLFLDVQQETVNGDSSFNDGKGGGPSPLGDCGGDNPDPACPGYSFYSCPSGGCELYMVQVNPSAYAYDPTTVGMSCSPYPTYNQNYPQNLNMLKNLTTGAILTSDNLTEQTGQAGMFPHLIDTSGSACATSSK
jgi:hypothetical protein